MNLFCGNLEELFKKYQVYSVPTMGMDDFMVVSGMPSVLGKHGKKDGSENNCRNYILFRGQACLRDCEHGVWPPRRIRGPAGIFCLIFVLIFLSIFFLLQIPHRPNLKLNVRMGFHRKVLGHKWQKYLTGLGKLSGGRHGRFVRIRIERVQGV